MGIRVQLLLTAAFLLLVLAFLLLGSLLEMPPASLLEGVVVALLAALGTTAMLHVKLSTRLTRAAGEARRILAELEQPVPGGRVQAISQTLEALSAALESSRNRLAEATQWRERAEESLRESEERYALAVRGADDGMWEWNLRTGSVLFSVRWKSMLGYAEHELDDSIEEWKARVHPQDRDRVLQELHTHLDGATERFESEHRLRHRDGSYRWILARGAAIRNAAGKPYRMLGLHSDISARKQVQEALLEVADGLSTLSGDACFRELTRRFAQVLGVREAFVCECSDFPASRVRMLAHWNHGAFANCVEFDLAGTSCETVIQDGQPLFIPARLGERWPLENSFDRESYLGLPCIDTQGRVLGHIACADGNEMRRELPHLAILKIFAIRAAVELERRMLERERFARVLPPADEGAQAVIH